MYRLWVPVRASMVNLLVCIVYCLDRLRPGRRARFQTFRKSFRKAYLPNERIDILVGRFWPPPDQ